MSLNHRLPPLPFGAPDQSSAAFQPAYEQHLNGHLQQFDGPRQPAEPFDGIQEPAALPPLPPRKRPVWKKAVVLVPLVIMLVVVIAAVVAVLVVGLRGRGSAVDDEDGITTGRGAGVSVSTRGKAVASSVRPSSATSVGLSSTTSVGLSSTTSVEPSGTTRTMTIRRTSTQTFITTQVVSYRETTYAYDPTYTLAGSARL